MASKRIAEIMMVWSILVSFAAMAHEYFQPVNPPRSFQVMEHRGAMKQAPENVRSSIDKAVESGFEWVEIDVRLTKDHRHVILHDEEVNKVTNGTGPIVELTLAEVKQLDAGAWFAPRFAGERILTLKECFDVARNRINIYLDCKAIDPVMLAHEIMDAHMENQVIAYDKPENILVIQKESKGKVATMTKWHPDFGREEWLAKIHPDAVEINANEITPEICQFFHHQKITVQAQVLWESDKPEVWDAMLVAGVDWLQTDCAEDIITHRFRQEHAQSPVAISHHRAANFYAPENTMAAYEKSVSLCADYVEFDVRTSSDGKYFILHDQKLDRTTTGKGPINQMDATTLSALDAGSWFGKPFVGAKIPTLDETLKCLVNRTQLYVDAKDISGEKLIEKLKAFNAVEQAVVYQQPDYLIKLRTLEPALRRLCPLKSQDQVDSLAEAVQPYGFDVEWDILSKALIQKCHAKGIKIFSDALDKHERIEDYQRAIGWGIDVIQTDYPLRVMRAIETMPQSGKRTMP